MIQSSTNWRAVLLLYCCGVGTSMQLGKVPAALTVMSEELGLSLVVSGWLISLLNLTAMLCGMVVGSWSDHFGHLRALRMGLLCLAAGSMAAAGLSEPAWLLTARFFEGIGFLLVVTTTPPLMLAHSSVHDRRRVMGLWGAYMPLGMALIMVACPGILQAYGWRVLWLGDGVVMLVLLASTWLLPTTEVSRQLGLEPLHQRIQILFRLGKPLVLAAIFCMYGGAFLAIFGFLPLLISQEMGYGASTTAMLAALAVAVNILGNLAAGQMLQRGHSAVLLLTVATLGIMVFGLCMYTSALPTGVRYLAALLLSTVGGLIPATLFSQISESVPHPGLLGTGNGLLVQGSNVGQVLGPPALAWLVEGAGSWEGGRWMVLACMGPCLGALWLLVRMNNRSPVQEST